MVHNEYDERIKLRNKMIVHRPEGSPAAIIGYSPDSAPSYMAALSHSRFTSSVWRISVYAKDKVARGFTFYGIYYLPANSSDRARSIREEYLLSTIPGEKEVAKVGIWSSYIVIAVWHKC